MMLMMHVIICMFNARNRLDQTLGKPGMWSGGGEKDKQKVTVMSGLSHIDNKVSDVEYSSGSFLGRYNRIIRVCCHTSMSLLQVTRMEHKVEQALNLLDQLMKKQDQRDRLLQQQSQSQQSPQQGASSNVT